MSRRHVDGSFEPLPDKYIDSAFLDRLHAYAPGWEVPPIRNDLFSSGYGFIVDYLAEILKHQRTEDFTGAYKDQFEIDSELSTRDQTGFEKTFSGMMKLLYPHGGATAEEMEELIAFAMEARRRVREHILRIDDTFARHDFVYRRLADNTTVTVLTPEEAQYPEFSAPHVRPTQAAAGGQLPATEAPMHDFEAEDQSEGAGAEQEPAHAAATRPSIAELLSAGEGKRVEFKSSARWSYQKGDRDEVVEQTIVRTIAGFFNAEGGSLLIGVDDTGRPIGLEKDYKLVKGRGRDGFENWLTDLLEGAFGKPALANLSVSFQAIDGNDVCRIDVEPSRAPACLKSGTKADLYVRLNNSTRLMNTEEALEYVANHFR